MSNDKLYLVPESLLAGLEAALLDSPQSVQPLLDKVAAMRIRTADGPHAEQPSAEPCANSDERVSEEAEDADADTESHLRVQTVELHPSDDFKKLIYLAYGLLVMLAVLCIVTATWSGRATP